MKFTEIRRSTLVACAVATAALLIPAIVSCTGDGQTDGSVTGEIVDVVPQSIDTVATFTVRDESGELWTFGPARIPHFTPSHLIEHQANGDRITVFYRAAPDVGRTVVSITDAAS